MVFMFLLHREKKMWNQIGKNYIYLIHNTGNKKKNNKANHWILNSLYVITHCVIKFGNISQLSISQEYAVRYCCCHFSTYFPILSYYYLQTMNQINSHCKWESSTEASLTSFNKLLKRVYGLTSVKFSLWVDKVTLKIW